MEAGLVRYFAPSYTHTHNLPIPPLSFSFSLSLFPVSSFYLFISLSSLLTPKPPTIYLIGHKDLFFSLCHLLDLQEKCKITNAACDKQTIDMERHYIYNVPLLLLSVWFVICIVFKCFFLRFMRFYFDMHFS